MANYTTHHIGKITNLDATHKNYLQTDNPDDFNLPLKTLAHKREVYFICCICRKLKTCTINRVCDGFKEYEPIFNHPKNLCFKCAMPRLLWHDCAPDRNRILDRLPMGTCHQHSKEFYEIIKKGDKND